MTAKEKFEARLNFLGLADEWSSIGCFGRVATIAPNKEIVLFVHEDEKDKYTEIHYPSFDELRKNEKFVRMVADEHLDEPLRVLVETREPDEWAFKLNLAKWLRYGEGECPLHPVDVYFAADGMEKSYKDFEDDLESETLPDIYKGFKITIEREWATPVDEPSFLGYRGFIRRISDGLGKNSGGCIYKTRDEAIEEAWDEIDELTSNRRYAVEYGFSPAFGPLCRDGSGWKKCWNADELRAYLGDAYDIVHDAGKWWLVGRFTDGDLWMNNEDGCCYLNSTEAADIYYARFF